MVTLYYERWRLRPGAILKAGDVICQDKMYSQSDSPVVKTTASNDQCSALNENLSSLDRRQPL